MHGIDSDETPKFAAAAPQTGLAPSVASVAGLALALLAVGWWALPGEGEVLEWRVYLLLGTVFPVLLVAMGALARRSWARHLDVALGALGVATSLACAAVAWDPAAGWLAAACLAAAIAFDGAAGSGRDPWRRVVDHAVLGSLLLAASHAFVRIGWWRDDAIEASALGQTGAAFVAALVFGVGWVGAREPARRWSIRRMAAVALPVALLFAAASLRIPDMTQWVVRHHLGVYAGPADLVRGGGLLFWDVPAQYGALSTLCLAWLPGVSTWEALRLLNAAALFGSACVLFAVFVAGRPGPWRLVLGTALTLSVVFLLPGRPQALEGPFAMPSTGAFRFWPVYASLLLALWESRSARRAGPPSDVPLVVGSIAWVVAIAWSVEGGVYATATWLPAVWWSRFARSRRHLPLGAALRATLPTVLLPGVLLAVGVGGVTGWYRFVHGVSFDRAAYFEYASSFSTAFGTLPVTLGDYGGALFVVFVLISAALSAAFTRSDHVDRQVVALAAWGAVWATASYYVARSHPSQVISLTGVLVMAFATVSLGWRRSGGRLDPVIRWVAVALMASILYEVGHEPGRLRPFFTALRTDPGATTASRMPLPPRSLVHLMVEAEVAPGDRILFLDMDLVPTFGGSDRAPLPEGVELPARAWLPVVPLAGTLPLPEARRLEYVDRFAARGIEGWYVLRRPRALAGQPKARWLGETVDSRYVATRVFENAEWRLEWRVPVAR